MSIALACAVVVTTRVHERAGLRPRAYDPARTRSQRAPPRHHHARSRSRDRPYSRRRSSVRSGPPTRCRAAGGDRRNKPRPPGRSRLWFHAPVRSRSTSLGTTLALLRDRTRGFSRRLQVIAALLPHRKWAVPPASSTLFNGVQQGRSRDSGAIASSLPTIDAAHLFVRCDLAVRTDQRPSKERAR